MSHAPASQILSELRTEMVGRLVTAAEIQPPEGVPTGWPTLDRFLLWQGFPKGAVTLCISESGGATSLWIQSAAHLTRKKKWAAWVEGSASHLTPWSLRHKQTDLSKLLYVSQPRDTKQALWALQELMSLCLFDLIGFDLDSLRLKEHQILKLKKLAMRYQTALVILTKSPRVLHSSFTRWFFIFKKNKS